MILFEKERSGNREYLYHQNDENLSFGMHLHTSFEFIYVSDGELNLSVEDKTFALSSGHAALLLPNRAHSYKTAGYSRSYLCVFSHHYLYSFYEKTKDLTAENPVFYFKTHSALIDELQNPGTDTYALQSVFFRILSCATKDARFAGRNSKLSDILTRTLKYLESNFKEGVSLKTLAKELGYHYNYLSAVLGKMLQTSFLHLVNEYRINHAQHLLLSSELTITEIAAGCGYESLRSFNRNFLRITGTTPTLFRTENTIEPVRNITPTLYPGDKDKSIIRKQNLQDDFS